MNRGLQSTKDNKSRNSVIFRVSNMRTKYLLLKEKCVMLTDNRKKRDLSQ